MLIPILKKLSETKIEVGLLPELPNTTNADGSISLSIVVRVAIVQVRIPGVVSVVGFSGSRPIVVTG